MDNMVLGRGMNTREGMKNPTYFLDFIIFVTLSISRCFKIFTTLFCFPF